jgi:ferric-dicitrate binding protein FerR (iron transport regulator)
MGITMETPKDPHHDCMVRWREERELKDAAIQAAQLAWRSLDAKNAQIDSAESSAQTYKESAEWWRHYCWLAIYYAGAVTFALIVIAITHRH